MTTCFLNTRRILSQDNKGEYVGTETYTVGNIVSFNNARYFCSSAQGCSGEPGTDVTWKTLGANDALDLSNDNYSPTATYESPNPIVYHGFNWTCNGTTCSTVNPVDADENNPWVKGSTFVPPTDGTDGTDDTDTEEE